MIQKLGIDLGTLENNVKSQAIIRNRGWIFPLPPAMFEKVKALKNWTMANSREFSGCIGRKNPVGCHMLKFDTMGGDKYIPGHSVLQRFFAQKAL